jgi:hypothetical protein
MDIVRKLNISEIYIYKVKVKISLLQAMEAHRRLREVKVPTLLRQTVNRWWQSCQPYAPAALLPQGSFIFKDSWYSFLLEAESTPGPVRPGLDQFIKKIYIWILPFPLLSYNLVIFTIILFVGVDGLIVEDGDHYLFWYKKL